MADGSITFSTALDNKELESELNSLVKKIDTLEDKINQKQAEKMPLVDQTQQLGVELDAAKAKLFEMQNAATGAFSSNEIKEQTLHVSGLQSEWNSVQSRVDRYDTAINNATIELDRSKEKAGAVASELAAAGGNSVTMGDAINEAGAHLDKFFTRIKRLVTRVLFFSVITMALRGVREWFSNVIKASPQAMEAIARLKGALLTLAQPLLNVIIPAFTAFVDILAKIVSAIAQAVSMLFGSTAEQSAQAAENLYDEQNAIKGVGSAAKAASKSLAGFDEINKLSSDSTSSGGVASAASGIVPDFGAFDEDWLKNTLDGTAGMVTSALLLGGIALVAIGACIGSLKTVIAGLILLGSGIVVGTDTGVLQSWAETLGLDNVSEFITVAFLLAGIALVAFGAIFGRLPLVIAGIGFLGSGVAVGEESGTLSSWAKTLGLDSVFDYVTAAIQLSGIALIAIGACMANIFMVIAGAGILAVGIAADAIGEKRLSNWWDVLKLTSVQQWVGVALLLVGIGLIAVGAAMGNILMMIAGAGMLAFSSVVNVSDGNLEDWVTALGLEKVAGCVATALLLLGIGLIVFGIVSGNIMMVLAGAGLLGAGISVGATSGTFQTWMDAIVKGLKDTWTTIVDWWNTSVSPKLKKIKDFFKDNIINPLINGAEKFINYFIRGLNWLVEKVNSISFDLPDIMGGGHVGFSLPALSEIQLPRLATGAVIPPNREFMAILGDQKSGTNIEAPLETIVQAVMLALQKSGTSSSGGGQVIENAVYLDGEVIYRNQKKISKRHGVNLTGR